MPVLLAALDAGKNATNYVFEEIIEDSFVYKNIESGFKETFNGKIANAKNNPSDTDIEKILTTASGLPPTDLAEVRKEGLYGKSNHRRSAKYPLSEGDPKETKSEKAVLSRANDWTLIKYRGEGNDPNYNKAMLGKGKGQDGTAINPTAANIIERTGDKASYKYDYKDFIFTRWYGKIPNNYMLTLRRFPFPAEDNIMNPVIYDPNKQKPVSNIQPAIAQAITWMSPSTGNSLNEILKFDVGFNWKEATAGIQEIESKKRDKGFVGGFLDGLPKSKEIQQSVNGKSASTIHRRKQQGNNWDPLKQTFPNHEFAPLNVIKSMQVRESGLKFNQSFSLTFEYNLKGIPNTSPKVAFLDVLSNLLILTYNNAPFWGGGTRYTGGGQVGNPMGELKLLQKGDYKGFLKSIMKDIGKGLGSLADDLKGALSGDSKVINNLIGGGLMDLFGGPQGGQVAQAFITGESTGQWHLTIGNPLNPIAVIGNLGCTNAKFSFDGPLGYEDFPTKLKVTVDLQPNRPRDKGDIESMFNSGKGRLYIPESGVLDPSADYNVSAYGNKDIGAEKSKKHFFKKAAKYANG